jgi:soluble lytic murein transglycosylase
MTRVSGWIRIVVLSSWVLLCCSARSVQTEVRPAITASVPSMIPPPPPISLLPTATPDYALLTQQAHQALHDGEYERAIALFQEARRALHGPASQHLLLPLVRACFGAHQYEQLVELCTPADLNELPHDEQAIAQGLLARSLDALGRWKEAIAAYERYLELDDAAVCDVRQRMAEAYRELDQPEEAVEQLRSINWSDLGLSTRADVLEELADLTAKLGDEEGTLAAYEHILTFTTTAYYRSTILWKKGQLLLDMGRQAQAVATWRQAVDQYPQTWGAHASLLQLDGLDAAHISLLQRGQILYHNGRYEESITTLAAYRSANPFGFHSTSYYFSGLAHHALGQYPQAVEQFDVVIREYSWTAVAGDAWMAKARSLAMLGGDAIAVYRQFVTRNPSHERAAEALWRAAQMAERRGDWEQAGELYGWLASQYAEDSRAQEAAFRQALAAYVQNDFDRAAELWKQSLPADLAAHAPATEEDRQETARFLTWMGLANAHRGQAGIAEALWEQAAELAPHSYYGLRARDLLQGDALLLPSQVTMDVPAPEFGEETWKSIEEWVDNWSGIDAQVQGSVEDQALVRRAGALWQIGWHDQSLRAYRQFRDSIVSQPHRLLDLARHAYDNGVWAMVIDCSGRLMDLGRAAGDDEAPAALWSLSYPTAFGPLVLAEAASQDVDALLFLALIRQESLFNPYVTSWAGAVGLTQVMPQTGAWIAERLGPSGYEADWLLRPAVAVRFGTWYLGQALELFERSWPVAVAAYNAGWSSVRQWTGGEPARDPDLFYETIPLGETKAFVQRVYENYRHYQRIYGR